MNDEFQDSVQAITERFARSVVEMKEQVLKGLVPDGCDEVEHLQSHHVQLAMGASGQEEHLFFDGMLVGTFRTGVETRADHGVHLTCRFHPAIKE